MSYRISPVWWLILAVASPVIFPRLLIANRRFKADRARAKENQNKQPKYLVTLLEEIKP